MVPARHRERIDLSYGGCVEVDLIARWDGHISGTLLSAGGVPAASFDLEARRSGKGFSAYATTDEKGLFVFAGLAPGRLLN